MAGEERRKTILFVDDDDDFAYALSRVLEHAGYRVRRAGDGDEGLRMALEEPPDLVLLDFMMPVKSGFAVCLELRKMPALREVPIIGLTAFGQNVGEIHGLVAEDAHLHLQDCIEKPVEPNILLAQVARALA